MGHFKKLYLWASSSEYLQSIRKTSLLYLLGYVGLATIAKSPCFKDMKQ